MKSRISFDITPNTDFTEYVDARVDAHPICVQDSVHIGTKLRNRLLNSSIVLQIGNEVASAVHIKMLLNTVSKEIHGLVCSDIYPEDRQNFDSLQKLMNPRVINSLEKDIVGSKATILYLQLCQHVTSSFIQKDLSPVERIYKIWYAVYFLRCWRKWMIMPQNGYTLTHNFISSNAYACVEINAHALVLLILKLRSTSNLFLPPLFSSQPCEAIFRQMRSMGTSNYTKINFNLNELLHMIARVEIMNKIAYSCKEIAFPRKLAKMETDSQPVNLPSDQEIMEVMEKARSTALKHAKDVGIHLITSDITECEASLWNEVLLNWDENEINEDDPLDTPLPPEIPNENSQSDLSPDQNTSQIEIIEYDGSTRKVPKSTLIWMLSESKKRLSSDRLKRVQESSASTSRKNKQLKLESKSSRSEDIEIHLFKSEVLRIGEWAILSVGHLRTDFGLGTSEQNPINNYLDNYTSNYIIGLILGFRYVDRKNHILQCKSDYVPVDPALHIDHRSNQKEKHREKRSVEILGIWYTCSANGNLQAATCSRKIALYLDNYIASIKAPKTKKNDNSRISYELEFDLESELKNFTSHVVS